MNHRYERREILEGEIKVEESCRNCPATSIRHANGFRTYPGGRTSCGQQRAPNVIKPPALTKKDVEQFEALMKKTEEARAQRPVVKMTNLLTEPEARLKDAYIVLNLLYADLVAAGISSPGRQMAGRLLYSAGYAETVKKLEANI